MTERYADYNCHACRHRWVVRLDTGAPLVTPCPKCGSIAATLSRARRTRQPKQVTGPEPEPPKQLKPKGEAA